MSLKYDSSWIVLLLDIPKAGFLPFRSLGQPSLNAKPLFTPLCTSFSMLFLLYCPAHLFYIKYQCIKLYLLIFLLLVFLSPEFKPKTQGCINLIYIVGTQNFCLHLMEIKLILTSVLIYEIMKNLIFTHENFHHENNYQGRGRSIDKKITIHFKGLIVYKSTSNPLTNIPGYVLKT